jgi:peptidoglycan hydrolase CwlO-like protein
MKLHLFNQSDPVLLTIEDTRYKPLISLRQGIMVIEAELTQADKETIVAFLWDDRSYDLKELEKEVSSAERELESLEDDAEYLRDEIRDLEKAVAELETQKSDLEDAISELKGE